MPRVGVLALQGDVAEHLSVLASLGVDARRVLVPEHLDEVDALVMPGGESTTMAHLLVSSGLREPLAKRLDDKMPVLGTCAGLILLSTRVLDGRADQWSYGALDVVVRRNGYGRQIASFESPLVVSGVGEVPGVFIRAPRIVEWGDEVEVLASLEHDGELNPVFVRQGSVLGASFHPELTSDTKVHELFLDEL